MVVERKKNIHTKLYTNLTLVNHVLEYIRVFASHLRHICIHSTSLRIFFFFLVKMLKA